MDKNLSDELSAIEAKYKDASIEQLIAESEKAFTLYAHLSTMAAVRKSDGVKMTIPGLFQIIQDKTDTAMGNLVLEIISHGFTEWNERLMAMLMVLDNAITFVVGTMAAHHESEALDEPFDTSRAYRDIVTVLASTKGGSKQAA